MNAAMVNRALRAVEMGEAGVTEAEVLRQALAEMEVQRVAAQADGERGLQRMVLAAVVERGYHADWTPAQFAGRQVCKALEGLGELARLFVWGKAKVPWAFLLQAAAQEAREAFDQVWPWGECAPNASAEPGGPLWSELADVLIPLLSLAETTGIDAGAAVRAKVRWDVVRGVRGGRAGLGEFQDRGL